MPLKRWRASNWNGCAFRNRPTNTPRSFQVGSSSRVAIARALCMQPKVMLFDELHLGAWIPKMVKEVLETMIGLSEQDMTMLCVTHEMGFASQRRGSRDLHGCGRDRRRSAAGGVPLPTRGRRIGRGCSWVTSCGSDQRIGSSGGSTSTTPVMRYLSTPMRYSAAETRRDASWCGCLWGHQPGKLIEAEADDARS